jgi:endonuclease G
MFSNISPQNHGMNCGIWADAENYARNMAKTYGTVYVVTGPVLEKPAMDYKSIGINKVSVPEYFYKIMLSPIDGGKKARVFACIIPNKASDENIRSYSVSIDEIETRTGIDFFPLLDDTIENEIEALTELPKTIKAHSE